MLNVSSWAGLATRALSVPASLAQTSFPQPANRNFAADLLENCQEPQVLPVNLTIFANNAPLSTLSNQENVPHAQEGLPFPLSPSSITPGHLHSTRENPPPVYPTKERHSNHIPGNQILLQAGDNRFLPFTKPSVASQSHLLGHGGLESGDHRLTSDQPFSGSVPSVTPRHTMQDGDCCHVHLEEQQQGVNKSYPPVQRDSTLQYLYINSPMQLDHCRAMPVPQ
jgi:hypothetical protein